MNILHSFHFLLHFHLPSNQSRAAQAHSPLEQVFGKIGHHVKMYCDRSTVVLSFQLAFVNIRKTTNDEEHLLNSYL